jgi:predicted DCC family thiol-disulfide oxidoreductase YuxK
MEKNIIVFDGECNLCNGVVGWLLKFAPTDSFNFVAFQSPYGQSLLHTFGFPKKELTTVILIDEAGAHTHSDGFLKIVSQIPKWELVAALLAFIPRIIRDSIYKLASRNRVKWFGKSNTCRVSL